MSVRWQHCINHADKYSKADRLTRLSSRRRACPQPTGSRLSETTVTRALLRLRLAQIRALPGYQNAIFVKYKYTWEC